jgi:hypothetical protein
MYPSSTPLVPDDQYHERDFVPRDLDAERDFKDQHRRRPQRQNAIRRPSIANRFIRSVSRFFAAILIGVGLTLAWQSYPEVVNETPSHPGPRHWLGCCRRQVRRHLPNLPFRRNLRSRSS